MDIFSLGCVIAELFLDGNSPLFDLSKLLKYRTGGEESRSALAIALEKLNDSKNISNDTKYASPQQR